jgi:hypothetical protein
MKSTLRLIALLMINHTSFQLDSLCRDEWCFGFRERSNDFSALGEPGRGNG